MDNTLEILDRGMSCLTDNMGTVEAERFISILLREKFDYTEWQRQYYDSLPAAQFHTQAVDYAKAHPYEGKGERV